MHAKLDFGEKGGGQYSLLSLRVRHVEWPCSANARPLRPVSLRGQTQRTPVRVLQQHKHKARHLWRRPTAAAAAASGGGSRDPVLVWLSHH